MSTLLVEERQVVIPGDILAEGMEYLPGKGTFREDEKVIASRLGILHVKGSILSVIPVSGRYVPKRDDTVIGYVKDMSYSSWYVDVGYAYEASLSLKEATSEFIQRGTSLSKFFAIGDVIVTKITNVTKAKNIDLSMNGPGLRKLRGGKLIDIVPAKVPRVVGKQGSMISMVKEMTGCSIFAGQNGRIWIRGPSVPAEILATKAIRLIEANAHTKGLTDRVKAFLEENAVDVAPKEESKEAEE